MNGQNRSEKSVIAVVIFLLLLFAMTFNSTASASQYVQTSQGKYIHYEVNLSETTILVGRYEYRSVEWGNFTINLTIVSIAYDRGYTYINITANATPNLISVPNYYLANISAQDSLNSSMAMFLNPFLDFGSGPGESKWPQINNTTLFELKSETFGTVKIIESEFNLNYTDVVNGIIPPVNVSTYVTGDGKTTFSSGNGYISTYKLEVNQRYSYKGNYSNMSSEVLIDSNTGIIVYGSEHAKVTERYHSFVENNTNVTQMNYYYTNYTMRLVKTNFSLAYTLPPYDLYIVIGVTAIIVLAVIAFFVHKRRKVE